MIRPGQLDDAVVLVGGGVVVGREAGPVDEKSLAASTSTTGRTISPSL